MTVLSDSIRHTAALSRLQTASCMGLEPPSQAVIASNSCWVVCEAFSLLPTAFQHSLCCRPVKVAWRGGPGVDHRATEERWRCHVRSIVSPRCIAKAKPACQKQQRLLSCRGGLEGQVLGLTIQQMQPQLESQRSALLQQEEQLKLQLAGLERQLLHSLATSKVIGTVCACSCRAAEAAELKVGHPVSTHSLEMTVYCTTALV